MIDKATMDDRVENLKRMKQKGVVMFQGAVMEIERMLEGDTEADTDVQNLRTEFYKDWDDMDLRELLLRVCEEE